MHLKTISFISVSSISVATVYNKQRDGDTAQALGYINAMLTTQPRLPRLPGTVTEAPLLRHDGGLLLHEELHRLLLESLAGVVIGVHAAAQLKPLRSTLFKFWKENDEK